ncbi:hypothetical protein [Burkholderia dolosa]|uniref:hypothetical protein n=1 Tax=Burkholderia dolosa TaxID=152500 RepID=UPI0027D21BC5|nr:hypothetical protein [Burkholderia dolosa]
MAQLPQTEQRPPRLGGLIENVTTGQILEKCASWDKPGGASGTIRDPLQATPVSTDGGRGSLFSG